MGLEIPGFHHFMSLFSRLVFSSFIVYMGIFKNIYCEGGGNKAQKRLWCLGKERLSEDSVGIKAQGNVRG